jgi:glycosyltransferase involved in cell wall biosynthesis
MRILFANDSVGVVGGVQSYLETVMQGLAARGHQLGMVHCDENTGNRISPSLSTIPHFSVMASGLRRAVDEIGSWSADVCFSHNMHRLDVERMLLDNVPVVKLMHGYFGTCIGGQKTFFMPKGDPCSRKFGKACLGLYFPRRCGGLSINRMVAEYEWARKQNGYFRDYAAVVVASQHMKDEYVRNGMDEGKIHVVPLFPTTNRPEGETQPVRTGELCVVFFGRMTKLKGGDLLIRAVASASERLGRSIHLVMAGVGPQQASWERLAFQLRVKASFPGWVTSEKQAALFQAATLLAVPSVWPEPFGLVGLEAASYRVPAIAFDVGGICEWLADGVNGFLVQGRPPTAEAFADGLVRALSQPDELDIMRNVARETASEMSLRKHLDRLQTILAEASKRNMSRRSDDNRFIV